MTAVSCGPGPPPGHHPITVTPDAAKVASAFTSAADKLIRALDADLGRIKDKNARETIRTLEE